MKLLLDECVPEDLKDFISGHDVSTVSAMGWKGVRNGDLMLRAAQAGFEVFVTSDKNIPHQQNISKYQIAVVCFDVFRNTLS
jgi:predicted nuclease of predicted toxin-antitoxin system